MTPHASRGTTSSSTSPIKLALMENLILHCFLPSYLHPYLPIPVDMGLDDHELTIPISRPSLPQ